MPSLEQSSLQPLLESARGHLFLPQDSLGKGLFLLSPLVIGGPDLSTTLTDVPTGPGCLETVSLIILARQEFLVAGMDRVAVAPDPLNHVALSSFITRLLSCFVL